MRTKTFRPPRKLAWLGLTSVSILLTTTVFAQRAIDGDSIKLGGKAYRLHGIDAPDPDQVCADGWPAGLAAEQYLDSLMQGKRVACVPIVGRQDGETVAICRADGVDLGGAMVTGGYAYAYVPHSARYISQEAAALRADRGVHAHKCIAPWKWRTHLGQSQ